ncbi:alpha/beta hydrolase [Cohnella lubricantis]|uniref:Alpha/beta hydrolase n=1 Tax=Cohnella lubricantis TaxID=2163172 RepID=A0A841TCU8_9BACL|nr:alpha/beta hydrolase [Cohnella lubricantis]MBB6678006.1 alpha/beta hydrolase [Cohnella lubricantis]MBP2118161.1 pimeloyl-ACP methyl ester carboxylesterase [Cohnella lubricantis]
MMEATLHDGSRIPIEVQGTGPSILLPVNPKPIEGSQADEMRQWGVDPALGRSLIEGLSGQYCVIAFDYEGHVQRSPKPDTLTPANVAADLLTIADASGAGRFAYYGYSWLALIGLQLAMRTDRLSALIMGGFPPIGGPYKEMLRVTMATYEMATAPKEPAEAQTYAASASADDFDWSTVEVTLSEAQTKQFVTLYQQLQDFDDRTAQASVRCPRLCFAGSADKIEYGERWGDVTVDIAGPLLNGREELEALGWDVRVLDGLDHTQTMQASNVLPIIRPWLDAKLLNL